MAVYCLRSPGKLSDNKLITSQGLGTHLYLSCAKWSFLFEIFYSKKTYPFKFEKSSYQDKRLIYVANHTFSIIFVKSFVAVI